MGHLDWQMIAAMGIWGSGVLGAVTYLHSRHTDEIRRHREEEQKEHRLIEARVEDLTKTVREHYVRRQDFDLMLANVTHGMDKIAVRMEAVGIRVDEVFALMARR